MAHYITDENSNRIKVAGNYGNSIYSLLNKLYPVNCKFIFPSGSEDPASYIGGTWTKIASNINLPLGSYSPVIAREQTIDSKYYTGQPTTFKNALGATPPNSTIGIYNQVATTIANSGSYIVGEGLALSNSWADLTNTGNQINVDIWERVG